MGDISNVKKICGFYVSGIHLITMILPYIKNEIRKDINIETILEYNLNENINDVLSKLIIEDEEKNRILNINWNNKRIQKYSNFEKELKNKIESTDEIDLLISGRRKYIEEVNIIIDRFLQKNKISDKKINIIDCYEVTDFDDNIREILDTHEFILNTSGIHDIGDIFEDYSKKKIN